MSVLTINRTSAVRVELLTATEALVGNLAGMRGGSVGYTSAKSVHGSAKLDVEDVGQSVDWLTARIRPIISIAGYGETALGVFLPSEAPEDWDATGRTWALQFLDKCTILAQDKIAATYALDAGSVVTDEVVTVIESTGETNHAITPSAAVLANPLTWPPGTTKLQIVNDLLSVINYFSLFTNGDGQFRGEPYVKPASRPTVHEFMDGENCIYIPTFTKDVDLFIPNRFIAMSQGDGTTEGLISVADNENVDSPYSIPRRGRVIAADPATGVEVADQTTLDAYALRRLIELTTSSASTEIRHAFVPGVSFNQAAWFRRVPAGIDARHVVSKTEISLDPTALAKSTLTEVVDL